MFQLKKTLLLLLSLKLVSAEESDFIIPKSLSIGSATSAYQIEGAWNASGKSESFWDHLTHNYPNKIYDLSNGNIACDSYHKYKEDVKIMKDIGIRHYRFSISWTRILPTGSMNKINKEGIRYYHNLLDELQRNNIEPYVTLYHWDHPQTLEDAGGWLTEKMAYEFSDYARVIFKEYGHRVKIFSTLNEPYSFCEHRYRQSRYYPNVTNGWSDYICMHNMLKAHALAYHIYDQEFRSKFNGQIGIVIPSTYAYGDAESMDTAFEFNVGWTANAIYSKDGDYPEVMKRKIAERSKAQGLSESRLPSFSEKWIKYIRGTADYFGLNQYTCFLVSPLKPSEILEWPNDEGFIYSQDPEWPLSEAKWLRACPKGFGDSLRKIKEKYNNPPVYIMENGVGDGNGIQDIFRINYLYSYMKEMLIAIKQDGCNVKSYSIWSLLDNFEWSDGYSVHFGLYEIDLNNENRTRIPKESAKWIKAVLSSGKLLPPNYIS